MTKSTRRRRSRGPGMVQLADVAPPATKKPITAAGLATLRSTNGNLYQLLRARDFQIDQERKKVRELTANADALLNMLNRMETQHIEFHGPDGQVFHPDWCRECRIDQVRAEQPTACADHDGYVERLRVAVGGSLTQGPEDYITAAEEMAAELARVRAALGPLLYLSGTSERLAAGWLAEAAAGRIRAAIELCEPHPLWPLDSTVSILEVLLGEQARSEAHPERITRATSAAERDEVAT